MWTKEQTPGGGPTKVSCNIFKHSVVDGSRRSGELDESGDIVAIVRTTSDIGVHKRTKE